MLNYMRKEEAMKELIFDLILNISLLSVIGSLISKLQLVQNLILKERRKLRDQVLLALIFAGIIVIACYTGIRIGPYNMNTKVIGAMTAGLLGGPIVGLYASLIGSVYVYVFSPSPAFAMASAFATVLFGLLGGGFYPYFQRGKWKYKDLFLLTCFAEVCEMVCLLRFTVPMQMALDTVLQISGPMILLNSVGILIFISSFNNVFVRQDIESSRQLQKASELSKKCLELLEDGLYPGEHMTEMVSAILEETGWAGVMITDCDSVLECQGKNMAYPMDDGNRLPETARAAIESGTMQIADQVPVQGEGMEWMREYSVMAAPFLVKDKAAGCMSILTKKKWVTRESEAELLQNLVTVCSFRLTMAELDRQEVMRQRAEFKALQFQVNPHFLFNALNTISYVCREDSARARELLIILADYFRYNLDYEAYMVPLSEEIKHVRDYLEIEKARFEEKLEVTYELDEGPDIRVPTLILQPIVENAVRYGIGKDGKRTVHIRTEYKEDMCVVCISDQGKGFQPDILEKFRKGEPIGSSIGLSNVHKRMKSIYGEDAGLRIHSTEQGTTVEIRFLREGTKEKMEEEMEEETYEDRGGR